MFQEDRRETATIKERTLVRKAGLYEGQQFCGGFQIERIWVRLHFDDQLNKLRDRQRRVSILMYAQDAWTFERRH